MEAKVFNRLLKAIGENDNALDKIVNFYFPKIVYYLSFTFGEDIAEEAAQEFFMSLIEICKEQPYVEFPTTWVYRCAENHAKKLLKGEARANKCREQSLSQIGYYDESYADLYAEIDKLSFEEREILIKHVFEGYNFDEIGMMLNLRADAVRQRYHRLRLRLKNVLDECHV